MLRLVYRDGRESRSRRGQSRVDAVAPTKQFTAGEGTPACHGGSHRGDLGGVLVSGWEVVPWVPVGARWCHGGLLAGEAIGSTCQPEAKYLGPRRSSAGDTWHGRQ